MGFQFNLSGNPNGSSSRWYRILIDLAAISINVILLSKTVPQQRLLVLPIFGSGIVVFGVNLFKELQQIYRDHIKNNDKNDRYAPGKERRFCPYCGRAIGTCTCDTND